MGGGGGGGLDPGAVGHGEPLHQIVEGEAPGVPAGLPGQLAAACRDLGHNQAILKQDNDKYVTVLCDGTSGHECIVPIR